MQILSDTTASKVLHTREILLYDAPSLRTNNYYGPEAETYTPIKLTIKWYDNNQPQTVDVDGTIDGFGKDIRRSYGKDAPGIPDWLQELAFPEADVEDKNGPFPKPENWQ